MARRKPVKPVKKDEPVKKVARKKKEYTIPEIKFKRGGVNYKKGDRVQVAAGGDTETYTGTLRSILSSQLFVELDDGREKFFFYRGLKIKKLK